MYNPDSSYEKRKATLITQLYSTSENIIKQIEVDGASTSNNNFDNLFGPISSMYGVLKGIERLEKESPALSIDSLRGRHFNSEEIKDLEHIVGSLKSL